MKMIAQDKANHYIIGNLIYHIARIFAPPLIALIPVLFVALLKEGRDKLGYGHVSLMDVVWTIAGGVVPFLFNIISQL